MAAVCGPEVLEEAKHEIGRAAASTIPRLPRRNCCGVIAQQRAQSTIRLPARQGQSIMQAHNLILTAMSGFKCQQRRFPL